MYGRQIDFGGIKFCCLHSYALLQVRSLAATFTTIIGLSSLSQLPPDPAYHTLTSLVILTPRPSYVSHETLKGQERPGN